MRPIHQIVWRTFELAILSSLWSASIYADQATPASQIEVLPGFRVERVYSVPLEQQGSWICMAIDDRGRLICGD